MNNKRRFLGMVASIPALLILPGAPGGQAQEAPPLLVAPPSTPALPPTALPPIPVRPLTPEQQRAFAEILQPRPLLSPRQRGPGDVIPRCYLVFGLKSSGGKTLFTDAQGNPLRDSQGNPLPGALRVVPCVKFPDTPVLAPVGDTSLNQGPGHIITLGVQNR